MNPDVPATGGSRKAAPKVPPSPVRPPRRRSRFGWWIALAVLLVLGVVAALTARPAWRAVKRHRAEGFARQAEELIRQESWGPAFQRMRSALQLAPTNPRILRLAARLYAGAGSEVAFPYFESLIASPEGTVQDREDFAALALRLGNTQLAAGQVQSLLTSPNATARTFILAAQLQVARRSFTNAVRYARDAVRMDPSNPTNTLALASYLLASRIPANRDEARAVLWPIAKAEGPLQLSALSSIVSAPDSPRADREEVAAVLEAKAQRTLGEDLILQEVRVSLDPSQRTRLADELIERYGRGTPEQMGGVAAWLNRQQLFNRTLELLLPDVARSNSRLFQLRYEALMGREDYRAAYDFVSTDVTSKDPMEIEFLRCRTALRMKDAAAADSHFKNLLELAAREPRLLRSVADFALRSGRRDIANDAAQRLARSPRDAVAAYATLLRIADAQGETWVARDYCRKLAAANPQKTDNAIRFQIAYYDLLLNENLDSALAIAEAMHQAAPNDYSRRAVLGLAYLRKGELKKALETIDHQIVTWSKLPPGIRAITLAILGANQRDEAAGKLMGTTPLSSLKPEERDLIRPYVTEGHTGPVEDDSLPAFELPEKL